MVAPPTPRLAEVDARAPAAIAGDTLVHFDIRGDNVLLAADRVVVLDWPHASIGAAWTDLVFFAPSVAMQGGPAPAELARRYPIGERMLRLWDSISTGHERIEQSLVPRVVAIFWDVALPAAHRVTASHCPVST